MTLDDYGTAFRNVIRALLQMPDGSVRPANQNAPTGTIDKFFATVLLTSIESQGSDDIKLVNDTDSEDVIETRAGQRLLMASVQFFRTGAMERAHRLVGLLESSKARDLLQAASLGYVTSGKVNNITKVVDTIWEERAQLEIQLYLITEEQANIPTFGTFPVSVKVDTIYNA